MTKFIIIYGYNQYVKLDENLLDVYCDKSAVNGLEELFL
jgi:hypothetical protein